MEVTEAIRKPRELAHICLRPDWVFYGLAGGSRADAPVLRLSPSA
jgi:hypothetical protein